MATVADSKDPAARYGAAVDRQLAQATGRIRAHDLTVGGLALVALALAYAAGMMVLDQAVALPEWVRQLALAGFALAVIGVGYVAVVRPLGRRVNPLYAALKVEQTIDDAKNTLAGYVDARDRADVRDDVRAAIGAKAARAAGTADLNRTVDHRGLVYLGGAAVALGLLLVALFFVYRPAQFGSLLGRAFAPFTAAPIETRTRITLTEPAGGDITVTSGQSVTVKVTVAGKVPSPDRPNRLRVLYRHAADAPGYEELPLDPGETSRDWQVRVPDTVIRNGLWYKVAGGDGETAEHRVTVRSVPRYTGFEITYEYPRYVRREPETSTDPHLEAYRGTKITLIGTTNRTVRDGRLTFDPAREPVAGTPVPGRPDALRFEFVVTAGGSYRLGLTSTDGERNPDPPPFALRLIDDAPPQLEILKPEEDEVKLPANGQLAIDGRVGDDFGIDTVALRLRLAEPEDRPLAGKPFNDGQSFLRPTDNTWPRSLEYKDSVDLAKLTDPAGRVVPLAEGMVIEYWLEAADNRTKPGPAGPEPDPQVGRSKVKRVRLTPPVVEPEPKQQNDARREQRQNEERRFNQQQQEKLDKEERKPDRPAPKPQDAAKEPEKPPAEPQGKKEDPPPDPKDAKNDPNQKKDGSGGADGKQDGTPEKKPNDGAGQGATEAPMPKEKGNAGNDPPQHPKTDGMPPQGQPEAGNAGGAKQPDLAPMPQSKDQKELQNQADKVQQEIDKAARNGGERKPEPPADAAPPPAKKDDPADPSAAKPPPPKDGAGDGSTDAAKPEPKDGGGNSAGAPNPAPPEPKGGDSTDPKAPPPGTDKPAAKPQPKTGGNDPPMPPPGAEQQPNDPAGGGERKPSGTPPKGGGKSGDNTPEPKGTEPTPGGSDTPMPKTGDAGKGPPKSPDAPPSSAGKPTPKDDGNPMPGDDSQPKPTPDPGKPPPGQAKPTPKDGAGGDKSAQKSPEPGTGKPTPGDDRSATAPPPTPKAGDGAKGTPGGKPQELSPKQKEEVEQAVKDLTNPDPKKQDAARKKLDDTVGKGNREKAEEIAKGLNSDKPEERAAAQKKLDDLKKEADRQAGKGGTDGKEPPKGDATAQKSKDGGTDGKPDPKPGDKIDGKKDATAGQKPDPKELEKAGREAAEQLAKDLKSDDPATKAAAEKKLEAMKKEADRQAKAANDAKKDGAGGGKPDPKEVEKALDEMASGDPKAQAAAKEKLDQQLGKGAGDKAEKAMKDQQSDDPVKQAEGRKAENDLRNQAEQMAKGGTGPNDAPKGKELSQQERDELAKQLKNLNAPDPKDRKAAEEAIDKAVGKENRDRLQEAMADPNKADALQKELERLAQNRPQHGPGPDDPRNPREAGPNTTPPSPEAKADARNRLRSAELQLEQFERNKDNKDLLDRVGMTPGEYDELIDRLRKRLGELKQNVADLEKDDGPKPAGPVFNPGGSAKLDPRTTGPGTAGVAGPAASAPGYADAMKKFQQGAVKVRPKP